MKKFTLTLLTVLSFSLPSLSQQATSSNPIDKKFTELIETSNTFKGYKVVDFDKITSLQKETFSYIEELKSEIAANQKAAQTQKENLAKIETQLSNVNAQLEEVRADKDAIEFLGMPFSKGSYKTIMWGLVAALVLALALFVYRFKKGHSTTLEAKKRMQETEKEFETYRAKALEKEQKLGRLLQDERNRHAQKAG